MHITQKMNHTVRIAIIIFLCRLLSIKVHASCKDNIDSTIIVVGGGIAGLGAAKALTNVGECVLVIEAKDYIGGRIKTVNVGSIRSDLGAGWIHGMQNNPIKKLADKYKATCLKEPEIDTWREYGVAYDEIDNEKFNYKWIDWYRKKFLQNVWKIRKKLKRNANMEDAAEYFYKMDDMYDSAIDYRIAHYGIEDQHIGMDYGVESYKLSLKSFDKEGYFQGEDCVFPDGYDQIINGLSDNMSILYSTPAKLVEYSNDGVIVTTTNGVQYKAKQVIITASINVLKSNIIQFQPPLPRSKTKALNRLDMGQNDKIILTFSEKFWKTSRIAFVASDTTESTDYYDCTYAYGIPTLIGFFSGGSLLHDGSDVDILNVCLEQLSVILNTDLPQPTDYIISRWGDDPYTLGSYTYIPVGASFKDIKVLSRNVKEKVFFAGEGTHPKHFANTHGALLSGIRAAQEINGDAYLDY